MKKIYALEKIHDPYEPRETLLISFNFDSILNWCIDRKIEVGKVEQNKFNYTETNLITGKSKQKANTEFPDLSYYICDISEIFLE